MAIQTNALYWKVYKALDKFFSRTQLVHQPVREFKMPDGAKKVGKSITLFEYMLRLNDVRRGAEISAQNALFPFLVQAGFKTVLREHRDPKKRRPDFTVIESGEEVIIELKHYSPHQPDYSINRTGPFGSLLGPSRKGFSKGAAVATSLHEDYQKGSHKGVVLIQVALFTAVEKCSRAHYSHIYGPAQVRALERKYPFLRSYVSSTISPAQYVGEARDALRASWVVGKHLPIGKRDRGLAFKMGPKTLFTFNKMTVCGRVNYYIGIDMANLP